MQALITLSHGSRHDVAQRGVERLTAAAAITLGVEAVDAHLEFNTPDLAGAAEVAADAGYTSAVVVPLLFTRAFHATVDVPAALREARAATGVQLTLANGLGQGADIVNVLARRVWRDSPPSVPVILYPVGTSNLEAAARTTALGAALAEKLDREVTVVPATGAGDLIGNPGIEAAARDRERMHLLPLFVTDGLLLNRATRDLGRIQDATGAILTHSAPLTTDLSDIVASRYREALSESSDPT
ncbi:MULTISPECIES: sirohydrochlorin chelatase [Corynebacterium]|uniref:Sirohydrochlorin cobaltochelatase n=1 Tax=Corynebacterium lipophiloflavum (strain ATCC 700352 / DSM 44291 / CCUG 37336 / JCM 10383 / DMMZ 1944) TaxID=525263 RepID=C0XNX2_CORLD|nr:MULTISPECIES: sirohydrochlorin chelatase [Corynebacterium]EEI18085.1 sirohydrochlorin cobaltochelatase [Corynebacterium lipophiloflavum DSM 44291]MCT2154445.1 sirohydrochlorin chelatase [Corynebacterium sanguinis]